TAVVVRIVQVHVDSGKNAATDSGGRDDHINSSECFDTGLKHHFRNVISSPIRLRAVAHEQAIEEVFDIVRVEKFLETGGVVAKRKVNFCAYRANQCQAKRTD